MTLTPTKTRGRFEGAWQIFRFNIFLYALSGLFIAAVLMAMKWMPMPWPVRGALACAAGLAAFWAVAALGVAHCVYDRSAWRDFNWLKPHLPDRLDNWTNIHAGFDENTLRLQALWPAAQGATVDIYESNVTTERSIQLARAQDANLAGTLRGSFDRLPLGDRSQDVVFLLFAAHELRTPEKRAALFVECARCLKPGGVLVLAEHLRGPLLTLVFGPGALHFHSKTQWLNAAHAAPLALVAEQSITPFARGIIWRKPT